MTAALAFARIRFAKTSIVTDEVAKLRLIMSSYSENGLVPPHARRQFQSFLLSLDSEDFCLSAAGFFHIKLGILPTCNHPVRKCQIQAGKKCRFRLDPKLGHQFVSSLEPHSSRLDTNWCPNLGSRRNRLVPVVLQSHWYRARYQPVPQFQTQVVRRRNFRCAHHWTLQKYFVRRP
ncbi:hypothetical protein ISCGN_020515 [Ixodes scapularis]